MRRSRLVGLVFVAVALILLVVIMHHLSNNEVLSHLDTSDSPTGPGISSAALAATKAGSVNDNTIGVGDSQQHDPWQGYPKLSPYKAIKWEGESPQVQVNETWYELLALNGIDVDQIVTAARIADPKDWQKRFEEDLVELLTRMGHKPGVVATLKLMELPSGKVETLENVPMTEANRFQLVMARKKSGQPESRPTTLTAGWQGYPTLSPFDAIRWQGEVPQVQVNGTWYELLALNGIGVDQIISAAKIADERDWQRRIEDDLAEVLMRMGHNVDTRATLEVKELSSGNLTTLKDVPMTKEKRQQLIQARLQVK